MSDPVRGEVSEVDDGPEYDLDFRAHPERYRHTPDERGAFKIEPYKSELLPEWGIATLDDAEDGAEAIYERYREYREADRREASTGASGETESREADRREASTGASGETASREAEDFVGMDMARKYLQMGWTRAMRYAKYPGGNKYRTDDTGDRVEREPQEWYDDEKREIAVVYREFLDRVRDDEAYERAKREHRERHSE